MIFNNFKHKFILLLTLLLIIIWITNTSYAEIMSTSGLLNMKWEFKEWSIISEKQYLVKKNV